MLGLLGLVWGGASAADPPGSAPSLEFCERSSLSHTCPSPIPPVSGLMRGSLHPSLSYQQLWAGPSDVGCCLALPKEHVSVVQVQTSRATEGGEVKTAVGGKYFFRVPQMVHSHARTQTPARRDRFSKMRCEGPTGSSATAPRGTTVVANILASYWVPTRVLSVLWRTFPPSGPVRWSRILLPCYR